MSTPHKQIHEYDSRLEILEGLMGAGKSYWATRRMIIVLKEQARPVYTNLPLKLQVIRKYLRDRHGEPMANLVNQLTESHWRNFLRRQHKFSQFKTETELLCPCDLTPEQQQEIYDACQITYAENPPTLNKIASSTKFYINWIIAWFDYTHGQPIISGPDANHIPPASLIIIDELQRWHPMMKQAADPDRENLLSYITMSRHHAHWIWVLTQDAMNVSIEFRRLAHWVWVIWNRTEDEIAGPLKFKHLRFGRFAVRAMGYARFTKEEYELFKSSSSTNKLSLCAELFTIITNLPGSKFFFRFYSSETHLGSRRQLIKKLREGQIKAGVHPDLKVEEPQEEDTLMFKIIRKLFMFVAVALLIAVAFYIGLRNNTQQVQAEPTQQRIQWPDWSMVSKTPWIDGRPTRVNDRVGDTNATLEYISDDNRALVLVLDNEYWLWNFGSVPIRVGSIEDVRAAVAGIRASESTGSGPAIPAD